ncbi:MAG: cysteine desulfurase NifS [bacterium]|nr:cysteine desulfurase NifS [bacterium]
MIYLDYNATTPADAKVVEAMLPYFSDNFGNPSSAYRLAHTSLKAKEEAREKVASLIGAKPNEIVFTSGGTEADNFAIKGVAFANKNKGNHIITSTIEHHAVFNSCKWLEEQGFKISYIPVDKYGTIDLNKLKDSIMDKTILISVMHANNEVGTIEPINEIAKLANKNGIYFHTDAVQTTAKVPINVHNMGIDLFSLSAHKFYGPKGVGALFIKKGTKMDEFMHGGHQEKGMRAGTENIPGIAGLGKACELAIQNQYAEEERIKTLRDKLENKILNEIDEVVLNGHPTNRLAGTLNVCIKYVEGESMLLDLDSEGICASTGSACTSGSFDPSHVLVAMGVSPVTAQGALRFSIGRYTTEKDIDKVIEVLPRIVERLRKMSPLYKK